VTDGPWFHPVSGKECSRIVWERVTAHFADQQKAAEKQRTKETKPRKTPVRYTTKYMKAEAKRRGWHPRPNAERYDYRTKRTMDAEGAFDGFFDDGGEGQIAVQAAGKGEREAHWRRFETWGGSEGAVAKARRLRYRVFYWTFDFVEGLVGEERWA
jgi:hypothetical protein